VHRGGKKTLTFHSFRYSLSGLTQAKDKSGFILYLTEGTIFLIMHDFDNIIHVAFVEVCVLWVGAFQFWTLYCTVAHAVCTVNCWPLSYLKKPYMTQIALYVVCSESACLLHCNFIMLTLSCCRESQSDDENVCAPLRKWKDEGLDDFVQISVRYVWFSNHIKLIMT